MMQHVATAKSEVAAFATGAQTNPLSDSESNEQFGKLLQEQKSIHSLAGATENTTPQTSNKKSLQQSTDEVSKVASTAKREDTTSQPKSTSNEKLGTIDTPTSSSSQDKTAMPAVNEVDASLGVQTEGNDGKEGASVVNNLTDELKIANTKQQLQLVLPSEQDNIKSALESDNIVAQEWVSLVDNLQRLADARTTKRPLVDVEVQSIDVSKADMQKVEEPNLTTDDTNLTQLEGNKAVQSLSLLIDNALDEVLKASEIELSDTDVRQKTVKLLLEQPTVLQSLIGKLQTVSQKSDTDTAQQNTLDTTSDKTIKKDSLLANQQIETDGQVDLSSAENKALLKTLLVDSETDKTRSQEPVEFAKPVLSDASEKAVQAQQSETLLTTLESVSKQDESLQQDAQMDQVVNINLLNSSNNEKVISNNDIKNILNLTDNKLDKVLENIAKRVFDGKKVGEFISPEQIAQQVVIPKAVEIISSVESSTKDLIAALKMGLEEFKNQLSQGREPGIDLKALVSDALAKTTDTGAVVKAPVNLEQMLKNVSQVLDFAQTVNRTIEQHHDQTYNAVLRDVAQIQGEQSKQIQLNQFESKFEKAVNISKPEGHQQLAEKVRWMVNTKNLVAEIRLDPAELGSMHVKVAVSGESATINFVVQSQQARDAVDAATPRLREMLAEKGIELGQSSVRQESNGQQDQGDGELAGQNGHGNDEEDEVPEQILAQQNIVNGAIGGIDYFV